MNGHKNILEIEKLLQMQNVTAHYNGEARNTE